MIQPNLAPQLVVVGSSAGGVSALSTLVSTLATPFPVPIVIAQHLDPNRPSHLAEILSRRCKLPVRTVTDQETLEGGVVYVVPANRHVEMGDHHITLRSDIAEGPKPSVDLLLSSAAAAFGENLIAVILTGTGSDGTVGARAVKKAGGTVIIQDPRTAAFPSMPGSLAPNTVDISTEVEKIGPLLRDLLTGTKIPSPPEEDSDLQCLLEDVRLRSGINFHNYKLATIQRRLERRMAATGSANLKDYVLHLETHREEYQRLISSFLIKVTEFMRDPELFQHLREKIIPDLVERARRGENELRLWSAGCATGEEAYSLAILVCEVLGDDLDRFNIRIFATDLDPEAVAFARLGIYTSASLEDLPRELVEHYFTPVRGAYQIKKKVRALTVFGEHDLGQRAPFPRTDIVMSRNVLIYFTSELQRRTLQLFAFSLKEGGYLVLGKAESTGPLSDAFTLYNSELKIYQRLGSRLVIPAPRMAVPLPLPKRPLRPRLSALPAQELLPTELQRFRNANEHLLLNLPVGVILVNPHYDIVEINLIARSLLGIYHPAIGEDLVHLVQQGVLSRELKAAIDRTLGGESPVVIEDLPVDTPDINRPRHLQVSLHSQKLEEKDAKFDSVLILLSDITLMLESRRELEKSLQDHTRMVQDLRQALDDLKSSNASLLEKTRELESTNRELEEVRREAEDARTHSQVTLERIALVNRQLTSANEELSKVNEELRASNEEFLLTSEETNAATEEVETLNEELQSTNEELETTNEELQATIEELNTTNADLESRSQEVREMAVAADLERSHLQTILSGIGDGVLVVDSLGKIARANEAYRRMFVGSELVPFDKSGERLPPEATPQARVARGESFRMEFNTPTAEGPGRRYYEAIGQPIQESQGDGPPGGVIVVRDITDRSVQEIQERFLAMASHELRTPLVPLQGYLELMLRLIGENGGADEKSGREKLREYAGIAHSQVKHLASLISDLVDSQRIQTGTFKIKLEPVDLTPLVVQCVELGKKLAAGQNIVSDLEPRAILVRGDAARLEQVVMNLISNAVTHAATSDRIQVRLWQVQDWAELQVDDHGPGIPAEDLPKVFQSFFQVAPKDRPHRGGMGLGLYICKEIITAHGGHITVDSTEGVGSTFTITLPILPGH